MKEKVNLGVIGLGQRGGGLISLLLDVEGLNITALCDIHADRVAEAAELVKKNNPAPFCADDYRRLLNRTDIDAVFIATGWNTHISIAAEFMQNNKAVALEVGGAYGVEDCRGLVRLYERTKTPVMLMENCCYGMTEMMVGNMARQGVFGEIVHCSGAYGHDLRYEIANGQKLRHYRQREYMTHNRENYPTHELGPIAQILNINRGNRMVSLTSVASKAAGLKDYILQGRESDPGLDPYAFKQGDIVITNITCADGATIMLMLDTALPRSYSREFTVRGTRGSYIGLCDTVFLDGDSHASADYGNSHKYEKYLPELWREYRNNPKGGHGGMDYLVFSDFINRLRAGLSLPIDVYDTAAWMSVSCLSEQSIAAGGAPVEIPDFTNGAWKTRV